MKTLKKVLALMKETIFKGLWKIVCVVKIMDQQFSEKEENYEEMLGLYNLEELFTASVENPSMPTEGRWIIVCAEFYAFKRHMKESLTIEEIKQLECRHKELGRSLLILERQFNGLHKHYENLIEDAEKRYETAVYDYCKARIRFALKKGITKEEVSALKAYVGYRKRRLDEFEIESKRYERICEEVDSMMDELREDGFSIKKGMMKMKTKRKTETRKKSLNAIIEDAQGRAASIEHPKKERGLQR